MCLAVHLRYIGHSLIIYIYNHIYVCIHMHIVWIQYLNTIYIYACVHTHTHTTLLEWNYE